MKNTKRWLIASASVNLILMISIVILLLNQTNTKMVDITMEYQPKISTDSLQDLSTDDNAFFPERVSCNSIKPATGNFVKVKAFFKGADIRLRYFILNGVNYAGGSKCFSYDGKDTYFMNSYVPWNKELLIPFTAIVRSQANQNEVEFSIKVFDLNDNLVGQYPTGKESEKNTVENIKFALTVNNTIKLNTNTAVR